MMLVFVVGCLIAVVALLARHQRRLARRQQMFLDALNVFADELIRFQRHVDGNAVATNDFICWARQNIGELRVALFNDADWWKQRREMEEEG